MEEIFYFCYFLSIYFLNLLFQIHVVFFIRLDSPGIFGIDFSVADFYMYDRVDDTYKETKNRLLHQR